MATVNRKNILDALIRHETMAVDDIFKKENLGMDANRGQFNYLLRELIKGGFIFLLRGITPLTYTITEKGIRAGK